MTSDRSESTRQRIIEAASALFARHGYDRTSTAAIAKEAKLSQGIIFHYFKTKEQLFFTIVSEGVAWKNAQIQRAVAGMDDPIEKLRARGKAMAQLAKEAPDLFEVLVRHAPAMDMDLEKIERYGLLKDTHELVELFEEGKKLGVFKQIDTHIATFSMIGIFNINCLRWAAFGRSYDLEDALLRAFEMFMFGIVASEKHDRS